MKQIGHRPRAGGPRQRVRIRAHQPARGAARHGAGQVSAPWLLRQAGSRPLACAAAIAMAPPRHGAQARPAPAAPPAARRAACAASSKSADARSPRPRASRRCSARAAGPIFGAGGEVLFGRNLFVSFGVSRFQSDGERVVVFEDEAFPARHRHHRLDRADRGVGRLALRRPAAHGDSLSRWRRSAGTGTRRRRSSPTPARTSQFTKTGFQLLGGAEWRVGAVAGHRRRSRLDERAGRVHRADRRGGRLWRGRPGRRGVPGQGRDRALMARAPVRRRADGHGFRARVLAAVRSIPRGRVATYGDIAALAGAPGAARAVGNVMRQCNDPSVPCHRVIAVGRGPRRLRRLSRAEAPAAASRGARSDAARASAALPPCAGPRKPAQGARAATGPRRPPV